ncbi:MAG: glycosyltransferase family A protein [Pseudomonadota bacterium]
MTLVIPTYNRASLLNRLLTDLCSRAPADWELIVVDDGSTDATAEVIAHHAPRIRSMRQENQGVSAARNAGVRLASHHWIKFVDSDDLCPVDQLVLFLSEADELPERQLPVGLSEAFDSELRPLRLCDLNPPSDWPEAVMTPAQCMNFSFAAPMVLFRKNTFVMAGGFNERIHNGEDYELCLRILALGYVFIFKKQVISLVVHHDGDRLSASVRDMRYFQDRQYQMSEVANSVVRLADSDAGLNFSVILWMYGRHARFRGCFKEAKWFFKTAHQFSARRAVPESSFSYFLNLYAPQSLLFKAAALKKWFDTRL